MHQFQIDDLNDLALGCTLLGSGGGGDPRYELIMTRCAMEQGKSVNILSIDELSKDDLIIPVAYMGAPLVSLEKLPTGREFLPIFDMIEKHAGRAPTALIAFEIGGSNALCPLMLAAQLGLPVVDGDLLGRAFPKVYMTSCEVNGITASPAFLGDVMGNSVQVQANHSFALENLCRAMTVEMGSSCALALYLMDGEQAKQAIISGSISQALSIGRALAGNVPIQEAVVQSCGGSFIAQGMLMDVQQEVKDGFLMGKALLETQVGTICIDYQNEYLLAYCENQVLAVTPDIIALIDTESRLPITSDNLKYGMRLSLFSIPSPAIWKTEAGLKLVGPEAFNYHINHENLRIA